MKLCIVNRNTGYPVHDPRHPFGSVIELDDSEAASGIESGYLKPADPASPMFTVADAVALRAFTDRKKEAPVIVAENKPSPADEKKLADDAAKIAADAEAERKAEVDKILSAKPPQPPVSSKAKELKQPAAGEVKE